MRKHSIRQAIIIIAFSLLGAQARGYCPNPHDPDFTTVWMLSGAWCQSGECWWGSDEFFSLVWSRHPKFFDSPQSFEETCPPVPGTPMLAESTYIARNLTALVTPDVTDAVAGYLYLGGWDSTYDAVNGGSPKALGTAANGHLKITGGSLDLSGCIALHGTGCYERVGYNGSTGSVVQTGGTHHVENSISLGIGSTCAVAPGQSWCNPCDGDSTDVCSVGTFDLSGDGEVRVPQLDIGVQGTGTFTMTGGDVRTYPDNSGSSFVGRTYNYPSPGTSPFAAGIGTLNQSAGYLQQDVEFSVGSGGGSEGHVTISGTATFIARGALFAGGNTNNGAPIGGKAWIVQKENTTVKVGRHLVLGESETGEGSYEIRGGSLEQTGVGPFSLHGGTTPAIPMGVYVGMARGLYDQIPASGHGELTVVGKASTIHVKGVYQQATGSRLTAKIEYQYPNVTPVNVDGVATFEQGAKVKIELLDGYTPGPFSTFNILSASRIDGTGTIVLESPGPYWFLYTTGNPPNQLWAEYAPPGGC